MIVFASISPHPPLLLPSVGSEGDRAKVKRTTRALEELERRFAKAKPDTIIISSPHPDWGFNVPLYFLAGKFQGPIKPYLTESKDPDFYFEGGKDFYRSQIGALQTRLALISSADLSHCLKKEGPYGFHKDGPKFDQDLIKNLKRRDIRSILELDKKYPKAGECGLRSICFILGILDEAKIKWRIDILSYEGPFGVGYLVANFKL